MGSHSGAQVPAIPGSSIPGFPKVLSIQPADEQWGLVASRARPERGQRHLHHIPGQRLRYLGNEGSRVSGKKAGAWTRGYGWSLSPCTEDVLVWGPWWGWEVGLSFLYTWPVQAGGLLPLWLIKAGPRTRAWPPPSQPQVNVTQVPPLGIAPKPLSPAQLRPQASSPYASLETHLPQQLQTPAVLFSLTSRRVNYQRPQRTAASADLPGVGRIQGLSLRP